MKKLLGLLIFAIAGLLAGSLLYTYTQWNKPTLNDSLVLVEIPKGANSAKIGRILQSQGIIASGRIFHLWCRFHDLGGKLKAGWYEIPPGTTLGELAERFAAGKTASVKVTIPEGRATWEIYGILKRAFPALDSARWDSLTHSREFAASLGVESTDLEGYLLPETYAFAYGVSDTAIIGQLVRANLALRDELSAKNSTAWKALGSWHRVLTLASVVEEETGKTDERPHIAGVLFFAI